MYFKDLNLPEQLVHVLDNMGLTTPTPIQEAAIPVALAGGDILGSAQTGTGKTAAFGIPLIVYLMNNPQKNALVLTPTRELAVQIHEMLSKLAPKKERLFAALLIGGASISRQLSELKQRPRIIVGTPGRVNDHLAAKKLDLSKTDFFVLDETDLMVDMGFGPQIKRVVPYLPKKRQTLMFSATIPPKIETVAKAYLTDYVRIAVGSTTTPIEKINQEVITLHTDQKYLELVHQIGKREGSILIFVKTKHGADRLARNLTKEGIESLAIHGDLNQNQRQRALTDFRKQKSRILVATDVVARGIDIPKIGHVINYNLPKVPADYIHRIGRTARAGETGSAVCLLDGPEMPLWREIKKFIQSKGNLAVEITESKISAADVAVFKCAQEARALAYKTSKDSEVQEAKKEHPKKGFDRVQKKPDYRKDRPRTFKDSSRPSKDSSRSSFTKGPSVESAVLEHLKKEGASGEQKPVEKRKPRSFHLKGKPSKGGFENSRKGHFIRAAKKRRPSQG